MGRGNPNPKPIPRDKLGKRPEIYPGHAKVKRSILLPDYLAAIWDALKPDGIRRYLEKVKEAKYL